MNKVPIEIVNAFDAAKIRLATFYQLDAKQKGNYVGLIEDVINETINTLAEELAVEYSEGNPLFDHDGFLFKLQV